MSVANDIIKAAILGTGKQSPNLQVDEDESIEAALLLQQARLTLRRATSFPIWQNHLALPKPLPKETAKLANKATIHYLRLLLRGIHAFALRELLVAMAEAQVIAPDDLLPNLLLLGLKQAELRPYLLLILGQKGLYLAYEINNQNWKWALNSETYSLGEVLAAERWQEEVLIEELSKRTWKYQYGQNKGILDDLSAYPLVWSEPLAEAFMSYVRSVEKPKPNYGNWLDNSIAHQVATYAYKFPLAFAHPESFSSLPIEKSYQTSIVQMIKPIMNFRQKMQVAVKEG